MIEIYTIGVYNSTEDSYFKKLITNNIELFCDIRQRRGVRGSKYKYVNSTYLQSKLNALNIKYEYLKELAPTSEIRQIQKEADKLNGETKTQRVTLGDVFKKEYKSQVLSKFDFEKFSFELEEKGVKSVVFFCVEENATACHRSLVAEEFSKIIKTSIINL